MTINREQLKAIARQHINATRRDQKSITGKSVVDLDGKEALGWNSDRSAQEYVMTLFGLQHLFSYVKNNLSGDILYLGETTGKGPKELHEDAIAQELPYRVVALRTNPQLEENVGKERILQTSAEQLKGVQKESVGAILSVFGLCYSENPALAIQQADCALQPGGVLKAIFDGRDAKGITGFKKADAFEEELRKRGYDIASYEMLKTIPIPPNLPESVAKMFPKSTISTRTVLLAIKPPLTGGMSAQELLNADLQPFQEHMQQPDNQ